MSAKKRELAKARSADEVRLRETYNTLSRYLTLFRACTDDVIICWGKPFNAVMKDGSIVEDIRRRGKFRKHHILAWHKWYACVTAAHGVTDGMTSSYNEAVDKSLPVISANTFQFSDQDALEVAIKRSAPYIHLTAAGAEYQQLWDFLRDEERGLIEQLTRDYYRAGGERDIHAPTLAYLASGMSGYNDNRQSISAGVSRIQALLSSVAQFYGIPIFLS